METVVRLVVGLIAMALPAHAQGDLPGGPPLDARAFDALTLGQRMNTFDPDELYGVEEFLPGRRTIWKDARGCVRATWEQVDDQICFRYEHRPDTPVCWIYNIVDGELRGWFQSRADGLSVRLIPGTNPMICDWLGA